MSSEDDFLEGRTPQSIIEAEAAERLIARLHDADWNDDKQVELDTWLGVSVAHEVAYLRLEAGWKGADRLTVLRQPLHAPTFQVAPSTGTTKFRLAAAILMCAAIGAGIYAVGRPNSNQIFATPVGGRETITLSDGSVIELNTNSELRLPPGSRTATLVKGEAYFQIRHDPSRPFTLAVGNHRIVDLGTKFVVRQNSDKLEVSLVEGKARVERDSGATRTQSAVLSPGDVAIATQSNLVITRKSSSALADAMSWRSGMVVFHHTTLGDAAREFNRYNATQIRIANGDVENRVFAGKFRTDDADRFANVVAAALGLRVDRRADEIVISNK